MTEPVDLSTLQGLAAGAPAAREEELRSVALDPDTEPIVRAAAITLLAHDGTVTDPGQLEAGASPLVVSAASGANELQQGRALVAAAMSSQDIPPETFDVAAMPVGSSVAVEVRVAGADEQLQLAELAAGGSQPLVGLPSEIPLITLGRCQLAVLVDSTIRPEQLLQTPARPASIATRDLVDNTPWSVAFEVISAPRGGDVSLAVIDRRGLTRYVGTAKAVSPTALEVAVLPADVPATQPFQLDAVLEGGRLAIARAELGSEPGPRLEPQRLPPP